MPHRETITIMKREGPHILELREVLRKRLWDELDGITLNGSLHDRLPGNLSVSFAEIESEALMMSARQDIAISSGSACTSATIEPSYVLRACGVDERLAHGSIRIGIGRFNTLEEVEYAAKVIIEHVPRLREIRRSGEISTQFHVDRSR
jgi:cysteine desulfurase